MAETDLHLGAGSEVLADAAHEHARDILAQWRAHSLAVDEYSETGVESASRIADVFKVLSDPTRVYVVQVLIREGELCVHDLAESVQMSQSSVSHHLRILRHFRLVRCRRQGRKMVYSPDDSHLERMLGLCLDHLREG